MGPVEAPDPWGGLPPPGREPIENRWKYLSELLWLFGLWFLMWVAYRGAAAALVDPDSLLAGLLSILMPVVVSLLPPILWWKRIPAWFWDLVSKRRPEPGLPYLLTHRNLFSSVLVACLAVVVFFVFMNLSYPVIVRAMGVQPLEDLQFFAAWRAQGLEWLVSVTFLYMIIVGPVEELYHRGFIQDQINRKFPPYFGIFVASVVFVLAHVPIDFLVYKVSMLQWGVRWVSSFPFAVAMGVYYHWSRNIWGPAVYHGLYDWFLGISFLEYGSGASVNLTGAQVILLVGIWSAAELAIIVGLAYAFYRFLWKRSRPAGSLGFKVVGVSYGTRAGSRLAAYYRLFVSRPVSRFARRIDRTSWRRQQAWSVAAVGVVILGNLGFSGAFGIVPDLEDGSGGGGGGGHGYDGHLVALPLETEDSYVFEGEMMEFPYQQNNQRDYAYINVSLTWQDEPAVGPRYTNEPDTLRLELMLDDGTGYATLASNSGSGGRVLIEWVTSDKVEGFGVLVSVTAIECGDQVPLLSPIGMRDRADNGNSFRMDVELVVVE